MGFNDDSMGIPSGNSTELLKNGHRNRGYHMKYHDLANMHLFDVFLIEWE